VNSNGPFDPRKEAHLLSAYVDGELNPADVARVEAHMAENEDTRREVERLRRFNQVTGALRLKEAPPEEWENFWTSFRNRSERSLGWVLLIIGVTIIGIWSLFNLLMALVGTDALPLYVKGGVFAGAAGILILLISVIRERSHKRSRTRYKDVIR
jgi:anti-sigma factor RsiW